MSTNEYIASLVGILSLILAAIAYLKLTNKIKTIFAVIVVIVSFFMIGVISIIFFKGQDQQTGVNSSTTDQSDKQIESNTSTTDELDQQTGSNTSIVDESGKQTTSDSSTVDKLDKQTGVNTSTTDQSDKQTTSNSTTDQSNQLITTTSSKFIGNVHQKIAAGNSYSLVVKKDETLWAWGSNWQGKLGDGTNVDKKTPVKVMSQVATVYSSRDTSFAIKTDGTLWGWGYSSDRQVGVGEDVFWDGYWGGIHTPVKILDNVVFVAAGSTSTYAIKSDKTLWAWGSNGAGQLANGTTKISYTPIKIMDNIQSVAAGYNYVLIVKTDNTLWACGNNSGGCLGDGTTTNSSILIKIMDDVISVAASDRISFAIKKDGSLWSWGADDGLGKLGQGNISTTVVSKPTKILDNVKLVSPSTNTVFVIKNDGTLWGFGRNLGRQLFENKVGYTDYNTPTLINKSFLTVNTGYNHSLGVNKDGSLWSWGDNSNIQMSNETTLNYEGSLIQIMPPGSISTE